MAFADRAAVSIRSGKGGDGHVSFRREIFVPAGGPDGGDGGKGGDIIFEIDKGRNTLSEFRHNRKYSAGDGENGSKKRCSGKNGQDLILKVPEGTVIKEAGSGKIIADMSHSNKTKVVLKGGRGGKGNQHYATATMQAPMYAQPGQSAKELSIILELKVLADVGLIGCPNVGKSTLLSRVTNAKPEIANYHFTTIHPNLGVVDLDGAEGFVIADIPGLIEGASEGAGLGHQFLRHIERTKVLVHLVDAASSEGRDPIEDINTINEELISYNKSLGNKPQVIAANKIDLLPNDESEEAVKRIKEEYEPKGIKVFPISGISGKGIKELFYYVNELVKNTKEEPVIFESEYVFQNEAEQLPYSVDFNEEDNVYVVEGPRIERMLGYTNIDSEKGFEFFQKFLKDNGILDKLEALGIKDGDTVRMYGLEFDYYK